MEISGEVADNVIKSARAFTGERHQRDGRVRDAVRERDASSINEAVITIVSSNAQRMRGIQTGSSPSTISNSELAQAVEVVDWGVRTYGSYVGMCVVLQYNRSRLIMISRVD
jgi:exportin-T